MKFLFSILVLLISLPPAAYGNTPREETISAAIISDEINKEKLSIGEEMKREREIIRRSNVRGWDHIVELLAKSKKHSVSELISIFSDKRMPKREKLSFSVDPKESKHPYNRRLTKSERSNALSFYKDNWFFFRQASRQYGVPEEVILSILQIETRCGKFTGNQRILHRLARLAAASEPENVLKNYKRLRRQKERVTFQQVKDRAEYLENTFLPHVGAAISVAHHKGLHPLELRGSSAGALGLPQFLPGNYFQFGVDGDGNGQLDLFTPGDAVFSVANFLRSHGWSGGPLTREQQEKAIWHYNRSQPYITTVLKKADSLDHGMQQIMQQIKSEILRSPVSRITPARFEFPIDPSKTSPRF